MAARNKRGRKRRPRSTGEALILAQFSSKLTEIKSRKGCSAERLAQELGVCRASLYNYLKGTDMPSLWVLRKAHEIWGFTSDLLDLGRPAVGPQRKSLPGQGRFAFIESVQQRDVEVISTKRVGSDTLQLRVNIKFG